MVERNINMLEPRNNYPADRCNTEYNYWNYDLMECNTQKNVRNLKIILNFHMINNKINFCFVVLYIILLKTIFMHSKLNKIKYIIINNLYYIKNFIITYI